MAYGLWPAASYKSTTGSNVHQTWVQAHMNYTGMILIQVLNFLFESEVLGYNGGILTNLIINNSSMMNAL